MRLKFIIPLLFILNIGAAQNELPTDIAFRHITTANGLSQDEVRDIQQDKQGFMWFTTFNGLCRYDGKNTTKWKVQDSVTLKRMNEGIPMSHCIDSANDFWIGTDHEGVFYYNKKEKKFQNFLKNKNEEYSKYFVYKIICVNDIIYTATTKGLWIYNIKTKTETLLFNDIKISNIKTIFNAKAECTLLLTTLNNGIWQFCNNEWTIISGTEEYKNARDAFKINENGSLKYWIATESGVYTLENEKTTQILNVGSTCVFQDNQNKIWLASPKGLYCYYNNKINQYTHQSAIKSSISTDYILYIMADKQNNIWIASFTNGVNWFALDQQPIQTLPIKTDIAFKAKLDYTITNTNIIDGKTNKKWAINTTLEKSDYGFVQYKDSKGNFWWSIGNKGLYYFNTNTQKSSFFKPDEKDTTSLTHGSITSIFEDDLKNIWVTTFGGLHLYQPTSNNFVRLRHIVKGYDETANSMISHYIDKKGNMWLGKWEGGLDVFNPITKKYQHLSLADGLPNMSITAINADNTGTVWAATLNGIAKINPENIFTTKKISIKTYSERDGLPTNRLLAIKYELDAKNQQEKLYFRTDDGIAVLYPSRLKENDYAPQANIIDIKVNGQSYFKNEYANDAERITLNYNQNNINIEMVALSFVQPERNQYKYRLVGFEEDFGAITSDNIAKYTNLEPNNYTFEVIAINNDGVAGTPYRFSICIKPALWQRAEFKIGLFLFLFGITVWIIHTRINRIKKQEALARQLSESELAMLRAQMNPHFIFNCMNTIEAYIMMEQPEKASEYTRKFSKLTRAVLENSEKPLIPLEADIEMLKIYIELEQIRYRNRFQVQYDIPDALLDMEPNIPPMLLQPLVENAILHGLQHRNDANGVLKISARINAKQELECIVEDNGIGRTRSAEINALRTGDEKKSLATSITHKRLSLIEQQTKQSTNFMLIDLPQGTQAVIQLPLL
jgi:ligand-binding sensor domain-containing protein